MHDATHNASTQQQRHHVPCNTPSQRSFVVLPLALHSFSLHHALRANAAACSVHTGHSSYRQTPNTLGVVACDTSSCITQRSFEMLLVGRGFVLAFLSPRTTHHARANAAAACTVLSSLPPNTLGNKTHSSRRQTPNNLGVAARLFLNLVWLLLGSGSASHLLPRLAYQISISATARLSTLPRLDTRVKLQGSKLQK